MEKFSTFIRLYADCLEAIFCGICDLILRNIVQEDSNKIFGIQWIQNFIRNKYLIKFPMDLKSVYSNLFLGKER